MTAGLKPYREMKNSRSAWIGEVPSHWIVTALGNRYEQCLGKMLDTKRITGKYLVPYLRNIDVQWDQINISDLPLIDIRPNEMERYTLRPGDLVVCEGGEVGRCSIWSGEINVCGYQKALHRLRPRQKEGDRPRFLLYALWSAAQRGAFQDGHTSTIDHLTGEKLRAHHFAFPPESEQRCIDIFLNHADRRIQRYIRAKEKLIALLEEHKQATIQQAVTGQVDVRTGRPYPAYGDSGIKWIGSIPRDWEIAQLRRVTTARCDGPFGSGLKSSHYTGEGVRVIRLQNIGHGEYNNSDAAFISHEHYGTLGDHSVTAGDLLVAGLGDNNHPAGRACVAPSNIAPAMVKADCFRFRLIPARVNPHFVAIQLTATARTASAVLSTGATRQRINLESTAARAIAIPSPAEQNVIVEYLQPKPAKMTIHEL